MLNRNTTFLELLKSRLCLGVLLSGSLVVPPLCFLQIRRYSDPNLGVIPESVLGLGEPPFSCFARPEVSFRITLLNHALGASEVPSAEGKLAFEVTFDCGQLSTI
jgi:hypothetical protein